MSNHKRQYSIMLDASLKLKAAAKTLRPYPVPAPPTLSSVLTEIGSLPHEALFLGVASDGLPVLLNLDDPIPGPLLVLGEAGAGKTAFLQSIVNSITQTHKTDHLQYGLITDHADEWKHVENTPHRVGMFAASQKDAQDLMMFLASWAHENRDSDRTFLLLIDDLEAIAKLDFDSLQHFRWLLARGPSRNVWPIITMNADRYGQVLSWIPIFRTRVFGKIRNERTANALGGDKASALDTLEAKIQFSLRENGKWVRFWLPRF